MTEYVKAYGTWRDIDTQLVKVNGSWRYVDKKWVKVDGQWRESYRPGTHEMTVGSNGMIVGYATDVGAGTTGDLKPPVLTLPDTSSVSVWALVFNRQADITGMNLLYPAGSTQPKPPKFRITRTDTGNTCVISIVQPFGNLHGWEIKGDPLNLNPVPVGTKIGLEITADP